MLKKIISSTILLAIFSIGNAQSVSTIKTFTLGSTVEVRASSQIIEYNNKMFFAGFDSSKGFELWTSDGTPNGTQIFLDINTGANSSSPISFVESNGLLFFLAHSNSTDYHQLWVTNGTINGTFMVKELQDCCGGPGIRSFVRYNNKLYFRGIGVNGNVGLWYTDGTQAGTQLVKEVPGVDRPIVFNGKLYFGPTALWTSDGTSNGTFLLKNLNPPTSNGLLTSEFKVYNNKFYFTGVAAR